MQAYADNREAANELALEGDPVADAVVRLMEHQEEWWGTPTNLWRELSARVENEVKRSSAWPKAPHALTVRLKRLTPALRRAGIEYVEARMGHRRDRVKRLRRIPA